jgi:hypothetical protein
MSEPTVQAGLLDTDELLEDIERRQLELVHETLRNVCSPSHLRRRDERLFVAPEDTRRLAQAVIDVIEDHRHLREASILLVMDQSPWPVDKPWALRKPVCWARKLNGVAAWATGCHFMVTVLAEAWTKLHAIFDPDAHACKAAKVRWLDHVLSHCSTAIDGAWMPPDMVDDAAESHGESWLGVWPGAQADNGMLYGRWRKRDDQGRYKWTTVDQDVCDFATVIGRHGFSDTALAQIAAAACLSPSELGPLFAGSTKL